MATLRSLVLCAVLFHLLFSSTYARRHQKEVTRGGKEKNIRKWFSSKLNLTQNSEKHESYQENAGFVNGECRTEKYIDMLDLPTKQGIIYFPSCVEVTKCRGCCVGMKTCTAVETSKKKIQVLQIKAESYSSITSKDIEAGTFVTVEVENDKGCQCKCSSHAHQCNKDNHEFMDVDCTCMCKNSEDKKKCNVNQKWDDDECKCVCIRDHIPCSSGHEVDLSTCMCKEPEHYKKMTDQFMKKMKKMMGMDDDDNEI